MKGEREVGGWDVEIEKEEKGMQGKKKNDVKKRVTKVTKN